MTSAYIGNGQFVDGNTLFAADLTAFGADMTAAIELVADTALLPNPGARGVGIHQPLPHPSLSMVNPAYTGPVPIQALALSAGYGVLAQPPVQALPFAIQIRGVTSVSGAPQVAMGSKFFAWIGCDGSGNATGHYYANTGTANAPQVTEYVLSSTKAIADGNVHEIAMQLTASGGALFVDGNQVATSTSPAGIFPLPVPYEFAVRDLGGQPGLNPWQGEVHEAAVWNTDKYTGNYTINSGQYAGTEAGLVFLAHLNGNGADVLAAPYVSIGTRPVNATGVQFYLDPTKGDAVTYTVQEATIDATQPYLDREFTISAAGTGPNWFEPFVSTLNIFVASAAGAPLFRWM